MAAAGGGRIIDIIGRPLSGIVPLAERTASRTGRHHIAVLPLASGLFAGILAGSALLSIPGRSLGYRSPAPYLWFCGLSTLLVLTAALAALRWWRPAGLADFVIRSAVLSFALIVGVGQLLGWSGLLYPVFYAMLLVPLLAITAVISRGSEPPQWTARALRVHPALVLVPPIVLLVLAIGWVHPPVEFDSLSYHLFFPANWLQAHRIFVVPQPWGNVATPYEPHNAELYLLWLMLPFHGDFLARAGQVPFCLLAAAALYGIARQLGMRPAHALYPAGLFLLSQRVVEEAVGADVDIIFAALFLTTVYFGLIAWRSGRRADVALWGVSLGLWMGTKFLALFYSPLLLLFAFHRRVRRYVLWAAPGVLLLAAPWYLHNWIATGSPTYPVTLALAGVTIARGAYPRSVLLNSSWQEHLVTTDLAAHGRVIARAFGLHLLMLWAPMAILGLLALARSRDRRSTLIAVLMPLALIALFWVALPYNGWYNARFLFPAVGLLLLLVGSAFSCWPKAEPVLHAALAGGIIWILYSPADPAVPGVKAAEDAFLNPHYFWLYAGLAALTTVAIALPRAGIKRVVAVAAFCGVAAVSVAAYSFRACPDEGCAFLQTHPFTRPSLFFGWQWIEQNARGLRIAYVGNNIPYRLLGPHFTNDVYYVNIDRHFSWEWADYEHAARGTPGYTPTIPDFPYERRHPDQQAWLDNLSRLRIDCLFVARMSSLITEDVTHNATPFQFPIEDAWARSDPNRFPLMFEDHEVHIYYVRRGAAGGHP